MLLGSQVEPAAAAASDPAEDPLTGVGITPAKFELDLTERAFDFEVTVFNDTGTARSITMAVVELGHNLDGTPEFGDPLDEVVQTSGDSSFELQPGESVELGFSAAFPDSVSLYGALLAQIGQQESAGGAIGVRTQVASLLLLRGPRPWDQSLDARRVGLVEDEQRLFVDVANLGNAHVRPGGSFIVRQDGEEMATVQLTGENIIPGYARRLYAPWPSGLDPNSELELEVDLGDGVGLTDNVGPAEGALSGGDGPDAGSGSGAVLEGPAEASQSTIEGQRRVLLPLASLLVLLAIAGLWLLLLWKRREQAEEDGEQGDDPTTPVVASAGSDDASAKAGSTRD